MKTKSKRGYKDLSYFKPKECPFCQAKEVIRWGFRYNHITKKRRYKCNKCKKLFVVDDGFWKSKKQREFITQCIDLYVNGMSLRKVKTHIGQFSETTISHTAIAKWLKRYAILVKDFTDKLPIETSGVYHADEIFVKCNGEENYYWDVIDAHTRFLVATHYSDRRNYQNAKILFLKAKSRTDRPKVIHTDGWRAYQKAFRKVFWNRYKENKVDYIRIVEEEDTRNNIVERIQGTIRERVKVMRGFKNPESAKALLDLLIVYYNFIRTHQGIRMTPAEMCGVNLNLGKNKWLELIYRSKISL